MTEQTALGDLDVSAPDECPICSEELASSETVEMETELSVPDDTIVYRRHRRAHNDGADPTLDGEEDGDPYLVEYYAQDEDEENGDEIVGHIFDVELAYDAICRATVVAGNGHRAIEKTEQLRLQNKTDFDGNRPTIVGRDQVHSTVSSKKDIRRSDDDDILDRLEGWPW